ncbi:type II secretory protein PulD [Granulicella sp. 5B5]|uniref:type II secretory protein PulD n=1 Tax=Granulicella sp. 5B5 TaxID=1617967 RepID=UPI0015F4AE93|nr:type II secretory protein PulD [Granulicella sp. 5B5]QMV20043.1 type II secretory protein PulD [Granulicella sp. 5B5]
MMLCIPQPRWPRSPGKLRALVFGLACALTAACLPARAQTTPADSPTSVPAGALPPTPLATPAAPTDSPAYPQITPKQASDANDAYLEGLKQVQHKDLSAAVDHFALAARLNPGNRDYVLALLVAKGGRATQLVREAAAAEQAGDTAKSEALLTEARKFDPDNPIVAQHFGSAAKPVHPTGPVPADELASMLGGPIKLDAARGTKNFHLQAATRSILTRVYQDFGIRTTFDPSVQGSSATLDLDNVTFDDATRIALQMTHTFAVPVQPNLVLIVKDSPDNRQEFQPQIEETVYLPGYSQDQMTELANLARNVFDLKQVTASSTDGFMLLRGDEPSLRLVNATFADMLDGGNDVLFDVNLYEVSTSKTNNIGAVLPSSVGAFSVISEADSLLSSNASLLSQAISSGLLVLNGNPLQNIITEIEFLVASGAVSTTQFTNFVGTFGGGLTYAGLYLGSNSSFQFALNATDSRLLDAVQLRGSSGQEATFRAGSRYPVITGTYSSGVSSALSGLNVNGTSVASLLSQYLGGATASTPEFQFEDLGLTLKMTPTVQHGGDVTVKFDLKLEALGGTSLDNIPILDNRAMTSTVTIPPGKTVMLASLVSKSEIRSIDGVPGLSELPGFQGTDKDKEVDTDELLITITPHVVRTGRLHIESKALAAVHTISAQ